jgi:hypothetical protein
VSKKYTGRQVAIGSGSTSTSGAWFVGDYRLLTVSIESSASLGPTNVVIQGSNCDGLQQGDLGGPTSNTGWSNITTIIPGTLNIGTNVGRGIFTFDPPGYRWVRSFVSSTLQSVASNMTVIFAGVTY